MGSVSKWMDEIHQHKHWNLENYFIFSLHINYESHPRVQWRCRTFGGKDQKAQCGTSREEWVDIGRAFSLGRLFISKYLIICFQYFSGIIFILPTQGEGQFAAGQARVIHERQHGKSKLLHLYIASMWNTGAPWNSGACERLGLGAVGRTRVCGTGEVSLHQSSDTMSWYSKPISGGRFNHLYFNPPWWLKSGFPEKSPTMWSFLFRNVPDLRSSMIEAYLIQFPSFQIPFPRKYKSRTESEERTMVT